MVRPQEGMAISAKGKNIKMAAPKPGAAKKKFLPDSFEKNPI